MFVEAAIPFTVTVATPALALRETELTAVVVEIIPLTLEVNSLIKEERVLLLMTPEEIVEVTPLTAEERV